jgi:hypothetical protein
VTQAAALSSTKNTIRFARTVIASARPPSQKMITGGPAICTAPLPSPDAAPTAAITGNVGRP